MAPPAAFPYRGSPEPARTRRPVPPSPTHTLTTRVLQQPLRSSSTFPVKTNPWGRGRRRASRVPGKPRQQTPNRRFGPRRALTAARFAHFRRAGGRGREGVPSRSPDGGKRLAERSLAPAQRDVNTGPAAATRPPPGPTPATTRTPVVVTRCPRPAPTRDGGSRSNKWTGGRVGFIAPASASQD